jgi:hypothetical protein
MMRRGAAPNPASNIIAGTIDQDTTWYEDIELTQNGSPLTGVDDHVWTLTLYKEPGASADLTLTTADSTLTITESTATTLSIRCAASRLAGLCGDYMCDLKSTDSSPTVDGAARVYLWGRGVITVVEGAG